MSRRGALGLLTLLFLAPAARGEWAGGAQQTEVPLEGNGRSWFVRATLNGTVSGLFLVDTGASLCVIGPGLAQQLNPSVGGKEIELHTANGIVRAPIVELRTVEVGGNRARAVQAVVHSAVPPPLDGILGLSFLDHFSYAIDPKRRTLRLR